MSADEAPEILGNEELNDRAFASIERVLQDDEEVVALAGFDFERKVAAVTSRRVLIAEEERRRPASHWYGDVQQISRDGRTLVITKTEGREERHQMGADRTVVGAVQKRP